MLRLSLYKSLLISRTDVETAIITENLTEPLAICIILLCPGGGVICVRHRLRYCFITAKACLLLAHATWMSPIEKGGIYMHKLIKELEQEQIKESVPSFNIGDTVRVHAKIVEGAKERIQVFEGVVLKRQHGGLRETFTVRRLSYGVGVEKTWPLHSPRVDRVEVVRRGVVRRAKLFYLRDRIGKAAKVKEAIYTKAKNV